MDFKQGDWIEGFSWFTNPRRTNYRYRMDPVPGVHNYSRCASYYKRPKTYQEIRENEGIKDLEEEYGFKLSRPNRNGANMLSWWDDVLKGNVGSRTWKNNKKKKQYE